MTLLLDCSHPLDVAAATHAGVTCVGRYLSSVPGPKIVTTAEAASYHDAGIGLWLCYEDDGLDMAGGAQHGYYHGAVAAWEAAVVGLPSGCAVYMTCDTPAVPIGTRETATAFAGVLRVHGWRPGWYGNPDAGRLLLAAGVVDLIWAVDTWGSRDLSYCHIAQRPNMGQVGIGGVLCDFDDALTADWGQWWRPAPPT